MPVSPSMDSDNDDSSENSSKAPNVPHDDHGIPLVEVGEGRSLEISVQVQNAEERKQQRMRRGNAAYIIDKDECWNIGNEDMSWVEPEGTSKSDFDV